MFGLGTQELVIILAIVFLIFGAKRLPEIGSGLGKAIKNFKGGVKSIEEGTPINQRKKPRKKPRTRQAPNPFDLLELGPFVRDFPSPQLLRSPFIRLSAFP